MHDGLVDVPEQVVAALVATQFPQWQGMPVRAIRSHGTVNALYRAGDEVVLRFPLQPSPSTDAELAMEQENARRLGPHVSLAVPAPLGLGAPGPGYPGAWAAYRWIPGTTADAEEAADLTRLARDLAGFVRSVQAIDAGGQSWKGRGRGGPLSDHDEWVRHSLAQSTNLVDTMRLAQIWDHSRDTSRGDSADRWIHADLMPGNLLLRNGHLAAVLDLGTAGIGDPAVDLMPAWNTLDRPARAIYRETLAVDEPTWQRGRGWTLLQAIGCLWYYRGTNPVMAETAGKTLAALLTDDPAPGR